MHDFLKRCPCCGGKAKVVTSYAIGYRVWVACQKCGLRTRDRICSADSTTEWNRRVNK